MRKVAVGATALVIAFVFSLANYSRLPDEVPIHWNLAFEPDGFTSRRWAGVILPALFLLLIPLALLLPKVDPRRDSHAVHARTWRSVLNGTMVLLAVLQVLVVGNGLGWDFEMADAGSIVFGVALILLGNVSTRLRPNWFVGIRTPWTLSDDDVWRRTHRVGGFAMVASGILVVLAGQFAEGTVRTATWGVALATAFLLPVVASYVFWRRAHEAHAVGPTEN